MKNKKNKSADLLKMKCFADVFTAVKLNGSLAQKVKKNHRVR